MLLCDISVLNRYGKNKLDELLSPYKIDWYRLVSILVIYEIPGISQKGLAPFLQTDKGNISKLLQQMIDEKLIYRSINEKDNRTKGCYLTDVGTALVPIISKVMKDWENLLYQDITKEELTVYEKVSQKITSNLIQNWEEEK